MFDIMARIIIIAEILNRFYSWSNNYLRVWWKCLDLGANPLSCGLSLVVCTAINCTKLIMFGNSRLLPGTETRWEVVSHKLWEWVSTGREWSQTFGILKSSSREIGSGMQTEGRIAPESWLKYTAYVHLLFIFCLVGLSSPCLDLT